MSWLKQSTAETVELGPFVDSTDGVTAETALTIAQADIRLSKNGGAFAQTNNAAGATHMENGYYSVPLNTTDTNTLGRLRVGVNESGALPVWRDFMIVPANVWDSLFGADKLQVHADEITAGLLTNAAFADGAISEAKFANNAITDAKVASDVTIASVTGAVGSVTGAVGSVTAGVTLADGAIAPAKIADGAFTAAKFASGAFDAVWSVAARTLTAFGFSVTVGTNNDKTGYSLSVAPPTVAQILAGVVEGSITLQGALRLMLAALAGESTGGGTNTVTFRDVADTKARITATVTIDGNRTAVTRDITD